MLKDSAISTERQSNFELLRIIAMVMIIAHHISVHSGFHFSTDVITLNRLWVQFIQVGGKVGVNIFILISGYFLVKAKGVKTSKVLKLWIQIFSYSILFFIIFTALGVQSFSIKKLIQHIFPVIYSHWWFASTYFVLYLISPFINELLTKLDRSTYIKMLFLLTLFWCIIPTFTASTFQANELLWFIYLYAVAGYVKLWGNEKKTNINGGGKLYNSSVLAYNSNLLICRHI